MKTTIRPTTAADGPALAGFLSEMFGHAPDYPGVALRQLHWKYWLERVDWPGARSFVMARGSEILGHAGVIPGRYAWNGDRLRIIHVIDWAARPGAIGAGNALMKHVGRLAEALLAVGGSEQTLAMLPTLGFKAYGDAVGHVRILRPARHLSDASNRNWRLLPRFIRGTVWAVTASRRVEGAWTVTRLSPEDLASAAIPLPRPTPSMAVLERSAALFRHELACPATPMTLHRVDDAAGRPRGYFLLAFAPGQARIADCWMDSDRPTDWRALIQLAVRIAAQDPRVAEVVTVSSDAAFSTRLAECGFHARTVRRVELRPAPGVSLPSARVRVQMIDDDSAFMHAGRPEFWA
jgi:hypothetical protein